MASNEDDGSGRQHPRNMQGLLRLAVENTVSAPDTDAESPGFQALDENRRRWLESVLSSMSTNIAAVMRRAIDTLTLPEEPIACTDERVDSADDEQMLVVEKKVQALDDLLEYVHDIDFANDFHKIGGFSIVRPCLQSASGEIRSRAAEMIHELTENNSYCQQAAADERLIPDLIRLLDVDPCDAVRIKALYALSGILGNHPSSQKIFADCDGYSVLLRTLQSNVAKLRIKTAFLLSLLCLEQPNLKVDLCNMGFVEQLIAIVQGEHDQFHEYYFAALDDILLNNEPAVSECRRPELNFRKILLERQELTRDKDEFREEFGYCQKLMNVCFAAEEREDR